MARATMWHDAFDATQVGAQAGMAGLECGFFCAPGSGNQQVSQGRRCSHDIGDFCGRQELFNKASGTRLYQFDVCPHAYIWPAACRERTERIAVAVADGEGERYLTIRARAAQGRMVASDIRRTAVQVGYTEAVERGREAVGRLHVRLYQPFGCPTTQEPIAAAARAEETPIVFRLSRGKQAIGRATCGKIGVVGNSLDKPTNHSTLPNKVVDRPYSINCIITRGDMGAQWASLQGKWLW